MKRYRLKWIGLALLLLPGMVGCPLVYVPDKALESVIRAEIHKPFGLLTEGDLLGVKELDGRGLGIRELEGIQYCKNLAWLDLDTNKLTNIRALAELGRPENPFDSTLTYLNLDSNEITDIEPLAGLLNLQRLSLFNDQVADIGPLLTNKLAGGALTMVILDSKTLSAQAVDVDVPKLEAYGVSVSLVVPASTTGTTTGTTAK